VGGDHKGIFRHAATVEIPWMVEEDEVGWGRVRREIGVETGCGVETEERGGHGWILVATVCARFVVY
jgi:hypothetical protein